MIALPTGKKFVFNLYGMTDTGEPVSMFFRNTADTVSFMDDCPGKYDVMTLSGIGYDDFEIESNSTGARFRTDSQITRLDIDRWRCGKVS